MNKKEPDIAVYFHCKKCLKKGRPDNIAVGMHNPDTLRIWCEACNNLVAQIITAAELPVGPCECCEV